MVTNDCEKKRLMPVNISFGDAKGITVPYPAAEFAGRVNHGFSDTRGRPDLAATIAEGTASRALRNLLVALAQPGAKFFSVGCDLGAYEEKPAPGKILQVFGGYLQIMAADYANTEAACYQAAAERIGAGAREEVEKDAWDIKFALKDVRFELDGFGKITPSLDIWFYAYGLTKAAASASRERLLRAIAAGL
jgi:hypothetical protein